LILIVEVLCICYNQGDSLRVDTTLVWNVCLPLYLNNRKIEALWELRR
jgi:hypothetical protein